MFLKLGSEVIPNHGHVVISDIGTSMTDIDSLLCITDGVANTGDMNTEGNWFAPDGTRVNLLDVPGVRRNKDDMVVRLIRTTATGTPEEGIYHCMVQDATRVFQTVYVGLYNSGGGNCSGPCIHINVYYVLIATHIYIHVHVHVHVHIHSHNCIYMYYTTRMHKHTMHIHVHTAIHVIQTSTQVLYMYILTHTCARTYAYRQDIHTTQSSAFMLSVSYIYTTLPSLCTNNCNGSLGLCVAHGIRQRSLLLCASRTLLPWLAQ